MTVPPVQRAFLHFMKPFFQLLAVLGIILAGSSVYFIATEFDNASPDALVRGISTPRLLPGTMPGGGTGTGGTSALTSTSPFIWRTAQNMVPGIIALGNNGNHVLLTGKNAMQGTIVKLYSTATPTVPTAPVPVWSETVDLDSDWAVGAASENSDFYVVMRDVKVSPTDTFKRARLYAYNSSGLMWTYTFTNAQYPLTSLLSYMHVRIASTGKIIVLLKDVASPSLHLATFEVGATTPQIGTVATSFGYLGRVDISRDGTRAVAINTNSDSAYLLNLTTRTLIQTVLEGTQRALCTSLSDNGTKLVIGGFNYLKEYNWNGSTYVMETSYPIEGNLATCAKIDLSGDGTRAGFTVTRPEYQETTNLAFEVWNLNLTTNVATKHTTYVGSGSLYTQSTDIAINTGGTFFATGALGNNPPLVPQAHIYAIGQNAPMFEDLLSGSVVDLDLTPTGTYLATALSSPAGSPNSGIYSLYAVPSANQAPWTAPHGISATVVNRTTISIARWNHAVNAQQYRIYLGTQNEGCPPTLTPVVVGNQTLAHTFTGLSPNTNYYLSMKGTNTWGEGPCSDIIPLKTPRNDPAQNSLVPPGPPSSLSIGNLTLGSLRVTWSNPPGPPSGNAHTGIHIWRSTSPGVSTTGTPHATVNSATQMSYQDTQVSPSTTYYYKVTAFNGGGDSTPSNEAFNTPQFPNCGAGTYSAVTQQCELTLTVQNDDSIRSPSGGTWTSAWNATSGTVQADTSYLKVFQLPGTGAQIHHAYLAFDTSGIPDSAIIANGQLSLYVESAYSTDSSVTVPFVNDKAYLLRANNASTPLSSGDYEQCGYPQTTTGGPILANEIDMGAIPNGWNTLTLNANGTGFINKVGLTKLCLATHQAYTGTQALTSPSIESSDMIIESREGNLAQAPQLLVRWAP